ncbi:MAG TPA: hypothetical protein VH639_04655 [Bryobacteraceae bacterium]|jgi:hypothetical protein
MDTNRAEMHAPGSCDERARLVNLCAVAEWDYSRALQTLSIRLGTRAKPNFGELQDFVCSARTIVDKAQTALEHHTSQHGC